MSKTPEQVTAVGIFVFSALILVIAMLIGFGGRTWNRQTVSYRLYFYSRVKGLSAGSAVMFRGVKIGQVTDVSLFELSHDGGYVPHGELDFYKNSDLGENSHPIQVTIELDPQRLGYGMPWWQSFLPAFNDRVPNEIRARLAKMVLENGLCAQLQTASLLTGQLYIDFIIPQHKPDGQERKAREVELRLGVLPTRLTPLEKLSRQLGQKNFDNVFDSMTKLAYQFSNFVENGSSQKLLDDLARISNNVREVTAQLRIAMKGVVLLVNGGNKCLDDVRAQIDESAQTLRGALERADRLLVNLDAMVTEGRGELKPLLGSLSELVAGTRADLDEAQALLRNLKEATAEDAPLQRQLRQSLLECSRAAGEARELMERLNADPQRLIYGPPQDVRR